MLAAIKNQLPIQCRGSYFSRSFIQFSLNCSVEKMRSLSLAKLSPAPPLAALLLLPAAALQPGRRLTTRRLMVDSSPSASTSVECASPRRSQKARSAVRSSSFRNVGRRSDSAEPDSSHAVTISAAASSTDLRVWKSGAAASSPPSSSSASCDAASAVSAAAARLPSSPSPRPAAAASSSRAPSASSL